MSNFIPEIIIGFNPQREAKNWYETFFKEVIYGLKDGKSKFGLGSIPPEVGEIVSTAKSEQEAIDLINQKISLFISNPAMKEIMSQAIDAAKLRWDSVGNQYFTLLSKMLDIPISEFEERYYACFTFGVRCPFYNDWFMFSQYVDFSNVAMHEIMHIEFLKKYRQHCLDKGLDQTQISHLKEILTVILNQGMSHILPKPDPGYTKHQSIRPKVLELYQKNQEKGGSFIKFLDEVITLVKDTKL